MTGGVLPSPRPETFSRSMTALPEKISPSASSGQRAGSRSAQWSRSRLTGMPPVGVAVAEAEGVELEEHVVFTPVEIEAVGVVHKPAGGGEVVKGPEGFPVEVLLPEAARAERDLLPERFRPVPREGEAVTLHLPVRQGGWTPTYPAGRKSGAVPSAPLSLHKKW